MITKKKAFYALYSISGDKADDWLDNLDIKHLHQIKRIILADYGIKDFSEELTKDLCIVMTYLTELYLQNHESK